MKRKKPDSMRSKVAAKLKAQGYKPEDIEKTLNQLEAMARKGLRNKKASEN